MTHVTTITTKGQVTVPKEFRDAFGWRPGDKLAFEKDRDGVRITRAPALTRGQKMVDALRKMKFRDDGRTTDELLRDWRSEV